MLTVYRVDRGENTLEFRSDNEASLVRSDSGTGVETHSSLAASSFLSLRSSAFLCDPASSLRSFHVPFLVRGWQWLIAQGWPVFVAYNGRRVAASTYLRKKGFGRDHSHLRPCFNLVVSYPFLWPLVGRLELLLLVGDLCFLAFKPPAERVIIGKPDVRYRRCRRQSEYNQSEKLQLKPFALEWKNI